MLVQDATILRDLEAEPSVRLAVLFGSGAREALRPESDLDIGVLGVPQDRLNLLQVALTRSIGRDVDLIALESAPPLLRFEIAKDGRVLLERTRHLWSDFRARAMVDWWDWAPLARRFHRAAAARLRAQANRGPA